VLKDRWKYLCKSVAGSKWLAVEDVNKKDLFLISDIVIGLNSMLLLEAAAAGLPSIPIIQAIMLISFDCLKLIQKFMMCPVQKKLEIYY